MTSSANLPTTVPRLPRRFGRYMLFDLIGRGGMAEIFLAREETTHLGGHRLCVVKQIIGAFAAHPQFAEMLIHEAKLAAQLDHANIVQVLDLGRADGQLFIAMEYVEGFDLNELLRRCTTARVPLPFEFALLILADALKALDYAHRRPDENGVPLGIVHRDVSPSNLLISFEGECKLCDFGIAHANELITTRASDPGPSGGPPKPPGNLNGGGYLRDALQGKAGYMSPEHARGEPIDARADVFAAGILFWELIAGRRMYRPDPDRGTLLDIARAAEIPVLPERDLPNRDALYDIIRKALSIDRNARYASAKAMLRDLEGYMASSKLVASRLRLGDWLVQNFGSDVMQNRRMRQRAAEALQRGPAVVLTPVAVVPSPASPSNDREQGPPVSEEVPTVEDVSAKSAVVASSEAPPTAIAASSLTPSLAPTFASSLAPTFASSLAPRVTRPASPRGSVTRTAVCAVALAIVLAFVVAVFLHR